MKKSTRELRPLAESAQTQKVRALARRLAAYLPTSLTRQILDGELPQPGQAHHLTAATLFSDISGFTAMAETLARRGAKGAELLNHSLLMTFTSMINAIHAAGGIVARFHGDAMLVYFPDDDGRAAQRALACSRFMHSLMLTRTQLMVIGTGERQVASELAIKIGVSYGHCQEIVLGEIGESLEFVLAGTAVEAAVEAQQRARAGQVIASQAVLHRANLPANEPFRVVTEMAPVPSVPSLLNWQAYDEEALAYLVDVATAFLPRALAERLQDSNTQSIAEHRPITTIFVQFEGIDYQSVDGGEQLQRYYNWARHIVARHGGGNSRLNRVLTGDKGNHLHIIFGAPVAPHSPEQAIRCALVLQAERPAFITSQRIGVASGRAFACAVGAQSRREYTVIGRVINLSARLTQLCPEGGVLTDENTTKQIQSTLQWQRLAPVKMKGFQEPVSLSLVTGEHGNASQLKRRFSHSQPPVGRRNEMATLLGKMDEALKGNGNIVALSGALGSGQEQLLAAGVLHWLDEGGRGFVGHCQQHTMEMPLAPWQTVWREFFGLQPGMSAAAQVTAIAARVQTFLPHQQEDVGLWGAFLNIPMPLSFRLVDLPAGVQQARLFEIMHQTLAANAQQEPILLILEDVQWADQRSLDLIDSFANHIGLLPVLIVLTFRPAATVSLPVLRHRLVTHINLQDLPLHEVRSVIKHLIGVSHLPESVELRLGLQGTRELNVRLNPLFLSEALKLMLTSGVLTVEKDRVLVDEPLLNQMELPDSVYTLSLAQLDRLPVGARYLLQAAAVVGREFDLATLLGVTPGLTQEVAESILSELQGMEIVQIVVERPAPIYIFQRVLTHNAVYQSLPYARRQALHAAIADWIVHQHRANLQSFYAVLAYHYAETDRYEDGLKFALAAAQDAGAIYANREAAQLYQLALGHLQALGIQRHWQTAVSAFVARAQALIRQGDFVNGALAATDALKSLPAQAEADIRWSIYNLLMEIRYYQARYDEVKKLTAVVLREQTSVATIYQVEAMLFAGLASAGALNFAEANKQLQMAEDMLRTLPHRDGTLWSSLTMILISKGMVCRQQGLLEAARTVTHQGVQVAQQSGLPHLVGLALDELACIQDRLGEREAAITTMIEAIDLVRNSHRNLLSRFLVHRVQIYLRDGQVVLAQRDIQEALLYLEGMSDWQTLIHLYTLQGFELCRVTGDWTNALEPLQQANKLIQAQAAEGALFVEAQVRVWLAMSWAALRLSKESQAIIPLQLALRAVQRKLLFWWRPAIYYIVGIVEERRLSVESALAYWKMGLRAIEEGGDPAYRPLLMRQLTALRKRGA